MQPIAISSTPRSFGLSSLVLLLGLAACGGEDASGTAGEAPPAGVAEQSAAPSPGVVPAPPRGASSARIELKIGGGPLAGTHEATENVACVTDPGTWMVTSSGVGSQGITTLLLMVEGVPPTGGSSPEMSLTVHFGDPMSDAGAGSGSVTVDPAGGEGTGTATVRRDGPGAVIEVDGTTSNGETVSAVIRCGAVAGAA